MAPPLERPTGSQQRDPNASDDARDQRYLSAIAQGDSRALEQLYRAYHGRLCRFLRRMTTHDALTDEVINEVFWVVWRKAGDFQGQSRVSTWILGIAYRCMLKSLRERPGADLSLDELAPTEPHLSVPDDSQHHEQRQWLAQGMAQLSEQQRDTLKLAYYFGHSMEEIADITGEPVGTIKARLFHARVKLRNALPALAGMTAGPGVA